MKLSLEHHPYTPIIRQIIQRKKSTLALVEAGGGRTQSKAPKEETTLNKYIVGKYLLKVFQPGDVIVDVMAGVGEGAVAVLASQKGCYLLANDSHPAKVEMLKDLIKVCSDSLFPSSSAC